MQSRAVEITRVLLWKGITGSLARKRGSRGLASSSSLSARDSATAYLTNERRVLRLLTNDIPVPEAGRHDLDLPAVQVPHQVGDHTGLNNILRSNNVINKIMSIIINNIS